MNEAREERVCIQIDVSEELNNELERLSRDIGGSKADVFKKGLALALMGIAVAAKRAGQSIGIAEAG